MIKIKKIPLSLFIIFFFCSFPSFTFFPFFSSQDELQAQQERAETLTQFIAETANKQIGGKKK